MARKRLAHWAKLAIRPVLVLGAVGVAGTQLAPLTVGVLIEYANSQLQVSLDSLSALGQANLRRTELPDNGKAF